MTAFGYGVLKVLFRLIGRLCFRYQAMGSEHIPPQGGVLVAANHASYLDIPLLGCGIPRRVWFLGRHDLFPVPVLNRILQALGWIPMKQGRLDRGAFGKAVGLLRTGQAVAIFPEGSRTMTGHLRHGKPGIGVIVSQAQCPIVPAFIKGTFDVLPPGSRWPRFQRVTVVYGQPLDFTAEATTHTGKTFYQLVSRTVMEKIAELGKVASPTARDAVLDSSGSHAGSPAVDPYRAE
ncbi:MAG: lysophospholipid acyltransferase family protein [Nitrospiraceae bacterium]